MQKKPTTLFAGSPKPAQAHTLGAHPPPYPPPPAPSNHPAPDGAGQPTTFASVAGTFLGSVLEGFFGTRFAPSVLEVLVLLAPLFPTIAKVGWTGPKFEFAVRALINEVKGHREQQQNLSLLLRSTLIEVEPAGSAPLPSSLGGLVLRLNAFVLAHHASHRQTAPPSSVPSGSAPEPVPDEATLHLASAAMVSDGSEGDGASSDSTSSSNDEGKV